MSMANYDRLKDAAQDGDINRLYTLIQEDPYVLEHIDSIPFVETPLHVAAFKGHLEFATEIMRLKPSLAWKLNQQGFSPIHLAMQNDQKSMVLRFVQVDSNLVRVKGREGLTPLHLASQIGEVDLLADLLYACPDSIEDVTVRSETALHIAIKNQKYESLQVLIGMLKKNRERGSMEMEDMILNWKDVEGNTILHISALNNDSQVIGLLVKTWIDLNKKNSKKETALDMATDDGNIRDILSKAGAKRGASVTNAPTLADELRSKIKVVEKIIVLLLRIGNSISEEQRNAILLIAALVATVTYQAALSPPGGVFQANAGDNNNVNTTSSNSSTTNTRGKSVLSGKKFLALYFMNTFSFVLSIMILFILTTSWRLGIILHLPVYSMALCYFSAILVISPTSTFIAKILAGLYFFVIVVMTFAFLLVSQSRIQARIREIDRRNSARVNKW